MVELCQMRESTAREIFFRYEQSPADERSDVPDVIWRILEWYNANSHNILPMARQDLHILVEDAIQSWETDPIIVGQ